MSLKSRWFVVLGCVTVYMVAGCDSRKESELCHQVEKESVAFQKVKKLAKEGPEMACSHEEHVYTQASSLKQQDESGGFSRDRLNAAKLVMEGRIDDAASIFREMAAAGDTFGMVGLGGLYKSKGVEGDPDPEIAYEWFTKAADAGDYRGAWQIADLYRRGYLADQSNGALEAQWTETAETLLKQRGDPEDFYIVGSIYRIGRIRDKDLDKGEYYLRKAAVAGHWGARVSLAKLYYEIGRYDDACEALRQAEKQRPNKDLLESFTRGVPVKDIPKMREWYLRRENGKGVTH